jgi:hypothetical protein
VNDSTPEAAATQIQLTLTGPQAEHLRQVLPWLLRALADRPAVPERQRERRRKAQTALEHLQNALSTQLQNAEVDGPRPIVDLSV